MMFAFGTVLLFSIVQSLFGMGLLVFGTPTLLLLGFDFYQTLATLLPASIIISCLQLMENPTIERRFAKHFAVWCLPPLGLSLAALSVYGSAISLELVIGFLLLFFASFQLVPQLAGEPFLDLPRQLLAVVAGVFGLGQPNARPRGLLAQP